MLSLYPVYIFFTKLLNIHDNMFIWLIYCLNPPLNCKLHKLKNRVYICSSLNPLYLAHSQYGIYALSPVCWENSRSPTDVTSFYLLLHVLLHQHSSISARKEGERWKGNWGAQCQGYFWGYYVLHFLTDGDILISILADSRTPYSWSCHHTKKIKMWYFVNPF